LKVPGLTWIHPNAAVLQLATSDKFPNRTENVFPLVEMITLSADIVIIIILRNIVHGKVDLT